MLKQDISERNESNAYSQNTSSTNHFCDICVDFADRGVRNEARGITQGWGAGSAKRGCADGDRGRRPERRGKGCVHNQRDAYAGEFLNKYIGRSMYRIPESRKRVR
ncbi:protein of unknown function [Paraburkholderia kururiensis]